MQYEIKMLYISIIIIIYRAQKQPFADGNYNIAVLKSFAKFLEKQFCRSLFLIKVAGLRPQACNFI